jgi:pilus assembly protein CpaF
MAVFNKVVTKESTSPERVEKGRVRAQAASEFWETGSRLHHFIIEELKKQTGHSEEQEKMIIKELSEEFIKEEGGRMTFEEKHMLIESVEDELLGYGPITPLLEDHSISEIMVNGPKQVYYEQAGKLIRSSVTFRDDAHVQRVIEKIVSPIGRRVDESSPMVDARLPNGSRVNAIIPPLSLNGPTVTIRKFAETPFTVDDLIEFGSLNSDMAEFLKVCVMGRMNIFISGGTGSGKTSSLNVLSSFIPQDERIVTIEDAAELKLSQDHIISLEARPKNIEGKGEITIRDLVRNALRMRPDRIVVGEVRGAEALDMLQAMNTGHDGSLSTGHANSPRDMLSRIETMVMMAGYDLPVRAIREQIANALDLIVQQVRLKDGSRKITHITEVQGMEGDTIVLQDLFLYKETGVGQGRFFSTGIRPKFISQLEEEGLSVSPSWFRGEW